MGSSVKRPTLRPACRGLAEPNTVLISASTHRLTARLFDYSDLGAIAVKGFAEPLRVWQVMSESAVESRFEALRSGDALLVGREAEIELLLQRWARAKAGEGQVVLLSGEPGIGKSRLSNALQERIEGEPHARLCYFCSPYHQDSALHPAISQIKRAAGFERENSPETKLGKLEALLIPTASPNRDLALFAELLSLPATDRYPPPNVSPQRKREETLEALLRQLDLLSRQQPVLVVYEDVHWIDPTSRELLNAAVEQVKRLAVLLLVTCRPEFVPSWVGTAQQVTVISLSRLSRDEGTALAEQIACNKGLPIEILGEIVERTDGVPLFVEELTKAVLESGLLREDDGRYVLDGPLPPLAIPTSLRDSLMARLDRLAPVKGIAQIGAAIGREFSYDLLAAASSLPEAQLRQALEQLANAELVFAHGTPPESTYTFKHALVQDAAYATMLRSTRQQLHARIAQVLQEQFPDIVESQPEMLAHHFTESGLSEQAITYWHRAGRRASERSANAEAIAHLDRGLDLVRRLPATPTRARLELELAITLGPVLMSARGGAASEVEKAYLRAAELCRQVGEPSQLFTATWGLWHVYQQGRRKLRAAHELVGEILALARQQADPALLLQGEHAAWTTLSYVPDLPAARDHAERGRALYHAELHRAHKFIFAGHDPGVCCRSNGALVWWLLGFPDRALARAHEGMSLAEQLAHPVSLALSLLFSSFLHQFRREARLTLERAEATIATCAEHGVAPPFAAGGRIMRGWAMAAQGQADEAIAEIRDALDALHAIGAEIRRPYYLALLAEAHERAGQVDQGLSALAEALDLVEETGERRWEAEILRLRGKLLLGFGKRSSHDSEGCLRRAIEVARQQGAKMLELRAATSLASLCRDRGRGAEARDLLAPVYGWFTEGFETPDLQDAKDLLDELARTARWI